jgi:hypothetical protein
MAVAAPRRSGLIDHLQVRLVHQRRGLEGVIERLMAKMGRSPRTQLIVHQGQQALGGGAVAFGQPVQNLRRGLLHRHDADHCTGRQSRRRTLHASCAARTAITRLRA